ncbi:MAG: transporter [Pseudomonadota bacterium]
MLESLSSALKNQVDWPHPEFTGVASIKSRSARVTALFVTLCPSFACSDERDDIAQQLANPVASLISVPLQLNYDEKFGADAKGTLLRLNVQPVIPIGLNDDWNLISRTILPVVNQQDFPVPGYSEWGLSDTVQSLFFSPKEPTSNGWIWGAGPAFLIPTATDEFLGTEKWGAGPTAVALKQSGPWTYGGLTNHIESFAGESGRADISATFLQPFLTYITPAKTTFALNTESTYDWEAQEWSVPINFTVSQLLQMRGQIVSVGAGVRYWATSPDSAADGWGVRLIFTLVYPR